MTALSFLLLSDRGWGIAGNRLEGFALGLLRVIEIPAQLQVHPEISRHAKRLREAERSAWRYSPPSIYDLIDALIGYMEASASSRCVSLSGVRTPPAAFHQDASVSGVLGCEP